MSDDEPRSSRARGFVYDEEQAALHRERGMIYIGEDICVEQNIPPITDQYRTPSEQLVMPPTDPVDPPEGESLRIRRTFSHTEATDGCRSPVEYSPSR